MILLADASNEFTGQWLYVALGIALAVAAVMGIVGYFATSREVSALGDDLKDLTAQLMKQNELNENRASEIHSRVNSLEATTGRLEGKMEAFEQSFRNFTEIIRSTSGASNQTISAFTQSLDTFARIISDRNNHRS